MGGRRPEDAGEGWLSVQEAADALGVSTAAVRARIQRGTIEHESYQRETSGGRIETRHRIREEVIARELAERTKPARREDVTQEVAIQTEEMRQLAADLLRAVVEYGEVNRAILEAVIRNREAISSAVERQEHNFVGEVSELRRETNERNEYYQQVLAEMLERGRKDSEFMREMAEKEKEHQRHVREHERKMLELSQRERPVARKWWIVAYSVLILVMVAVVLIGLIAYEVLLMG